MISYYCRLYLKIRYLVTKTVPNIYTIFVEKPIFRQLFNAGIYIVNPNIIVLVESNKYLDMPDLIEHCKEIKKKLLVYPVHEYWLDVGKPESLEKAHFEWSKYTY